MLRKNMYKRLGAILCAVVCMPVLTACATNPTQQVVTSKNDGSFDVNVVQSASEDKDPDAVQDIKYYDVFCSTDGTVEFQLRIDQQLSDCNMPVVEVTPHYLTEDDAKRVCKVLFGDAEFNEAEPSMGNLKDTLTKSDIMEAIQRWSPYTSSDYLLEFFGNDSQRDITGYAEKIKEAIEYYTELFETVADDTRHESAKWTFQSDYYYIYSPEDIDERGLKNDPSANDQICVTVKDGDIPYLVQISVRNKEDYKLNTIFAYPQSQYSPWAFDNLLFNAKLCRTEKPTENQIAHIRTKAQDMLDRMELGQWVVDQCYLETTYVGEIPEYKVCVTAVPVINGVPVIRLQQLSNLKSEEAYASNYYLSDATFYFSSNGKLVWFQMFSTIDIKDTLNENVATLSVDELMAKARSHLSLSDYQEYGLNGDVLGVLKRQIEEEVICKIDICESEYGMTRVKVPNTDESYYYVPCLVLSGTVDYCGVETGTVYASSGDNFGHDRIVPLIALNAVDGTIIELYNE